MDRRVKNIFNNLEKKPDLIIIKNSNEPYIDDNFFYFTGIEQGLFEGSIAILYPDGKIDIIVSELEAEIAKKANVNINIYRNESEYEKLLKVPLSFVKSIGLNYNGISHKDFNKLKDNFKGLDFIDISKDITKNRLVKDELEISLIKKACEITDRVVEKIPQIIHSGIYEYELAAEIDYLMQKYGANKPAFETISSFGKNSSEPHYSHGEVQINKGDIVLCDFGACYKKYNSDITRTFIFGEASEKQKNMYKTVFEAQKIGLETIMPDIMAKDVHKAVDSYIERTEFKGRFIHSTGHSIGLAVHDSEVRISMNSDIKLKENMVFTVEPGVYIPGFGGVRIEDDVLIKKDGIEVLTKSSKELIEI